MDKFTVIIPTLDRAETLAHTLETCRAQQDAHFRVLVSDNLSSDHTREVVEAARRRDPRVEYIQPPRRMGMSTHWEFALEHVTEGFVMFLGADDGLLPGAIERARDCLREFPDARALHGLPCAGYFYPNLYTDDAGLLYMRTAPDRHLSDSGEWLAKVARSESNVTYLPMPYVCSFVHRSALDEIKAKAGRCISSPIPDIYLGVAAAAVLKNYVTVCPGFGIGGISVKSNGTGTIHPKGDRTIEESFKKENEIVFHPTVGYSRSVNILAGETILQAKDAGLLPSDFPIAWDRMVARAYHQFQSEPWNEAERRANVAELRALSVKVGCENVIDSAAAFATHREWEAALPFELAKDDSHWGLVLDTRPLGVTGIHEAAKLAGVIVDACVSSAAGNVQIATATESELLAWCVASQAMEATELRSRLHLAMVESTRRAAERDRAKASLAKTKAKRDKLRAAVDASRKVRRLDWLFGWLRPGRRDET